MAHKDLGYDVQHTGVATAATCGAMGDFLDVLEGGQDIFKRLVLMQSVGDIVKTYLFTVANHIIFFHGSTSSFFYPYSTRYGLIPLLEIQHFTLRLGKD
jgi:hypothetical protein